GHGDVLPGDLARRVPELDLGHVRTGPELGPPRRRRGQAHIDGRDARRARRGDARRLVAAVRAAVAGRLAHPVPNPMYMDWIPTRPGPVNFNRVMLVPVDALTAACSPDTRPPTLSPVFIAARAA